MEYDKLVPASLPAKDPSPFACTLSLPTNPVKVSSTPCILVVPSYSLVAPPDELAVSALAVMV